MTRAERAKQFLPFSALSGLDEAIAMQEFIPEERRILGEDAQAELDSTLRQLHSGDTITATYYHDRQYDVFTGSVTRLDPHRRILFVSQRAIPIDDLFSLVRA